LFVPILKFINLFVQYEAVGCCSLQEIVEENDGPTVYPPHNCREAGHLVKQFYSTHVLAVVSNDGRTRDILEAFPPLYSVRLVLSSMESGE
jgi:hypothetical protein